MPHSAVENLPHLVLLLGPPAALFVFLTTIWALRGLSKSSVRSTILFRVALICLTIAGIGAEAFYRTGPVLGEVLIAYCGSMSLLPTVAVHQAHTAKVGAVEASAKTR